MLKRQELTSFDPIFRVIFFLNHAYWSFLILHHIEGIELIELLTWPFIVSFALSWGTKKWQRRINRKGIWFYLVAFIFGAVHFYRIGLPWIQQLD